MGEKDSVTNKDFRKYLEYIRCSYKRTSGDHVVYTKPGLKRPIIFRAKGDIPLLHIKTNLKTLNVTLKDFLETIKKF
ncbi:MAG: hypothetical protein ACM3S2_19975 [Ignavibacteriales bacterium]